MQNEERIVITKVFLSQYFLKVKTICFCFVGFVATFKAPLGQPVQIRWSWPAGWVNGAVSNISAGFLLLRCHLCAWIDLLDAVCVLQIGSLKAPGCSAQNTRELANSVIYGAKIQALHNGLLGKSVQAGWVKGQNWPEKEQPSKSRKERKNGDRNNLLENKLRGRLETGLALEGTMANMMIASMFFLNINQSTMNKWHTVALE